jgi:DNA polymerase-3 subunit gamma/tau
MGKALYRKYRSKSLAEVLGQEHITTALTNSLKSGSISHAYLFTGPRGVGKTSTARILAHEVNGLPYDEDQTHLDIIEIDAASNRRIEEIRDLRDRVHIAPSSGKYKVYIIDEVHMLTKEAFNALLKTLEEPPAHAIFILATTESHKLPETIVSRTQRYTFKPADPAIVIAHLRFIATSEHIDITDEALALVARHGDGSFRDSVSLLDQARNIEGTIGIDDIGRLLGIAPEEALATIWQAIEAHDTALIAQTLTDLRSQGYQSAQLAKQLGVRFRQALLDGHHATDKLMPTLKALIEVPVSHDADTALELALFGLTLQGQPTQAAPGIVPTPGVASPVPKPPTVIPAPAPKPREDAAPPAKPAPEKPAQPKTETKAEAAPAVTEAPKAMDAVVEAPAPSVSADLNEAAWFAVLEVLKQKYKTLYSVMRMAEANFTDDTLTLGFKFAFHQKRVSDNKNKQILVDVIKEKTGKVVTLNLVVSAIAMPNTPSAQAPKAAAPEAAPSPAVPNAAVPDAIANVFGGGEILES